MKVSVLNTFVFVVYYTKDKRLRENADKRMVSYQYLYHPEYYKDILECGSHFSDKKLSYKELPNATVLPQNRQIGERTGGIITEDGVYLNNSTINYGFGSAYSFRQDEVKHSGETIIFLGMFADVWGHCITDNIRRMWFFQSKEYLEKYRDCRIGYIKRNNFRFSENFSQLLHILGIDPHRLEPIEELTTFQTIILPDESFYFDEKGKAFFTEEYRQMIDIVRKYASEHRTETGFDKVYFSYSRYAKLKMIGEEKLERFFKRQGYRVIAPEQKSFLEQINILANCKAFASTLGSCSHNSVFLPDGASVIHIPRAYYLPEHQPALDEVHPLQVSYVSSSLSVMVDSRNPYLGPFYMFVSKNLADCFGEKEPDGRLKRKNLGDFGFYLKYAYSKNYRCDFTAPEWYDREAVRYLNDLRNDSLFLRLVNRFRIMETLVYLRNRILRR